MDNKKDSSKTGWTGNPFAEVNMDEVIEELLENISDNSVERIELLREQQYYG